MSEEGLILGVFEPGYDFDGWRLEAEMRSGAQGTIIRATHLASGEPAVLKVVSTHRQADVHRFQREREILERLRHDDIVSLRSADTYRDKLAYLALEYIPGVNLRQYADERRLGLDDRLSLFLGLCNIVAFVHDLGVVHCDLNPSNILVTGEGRLKLIDLGSAFVNGNPGHGGRGLDNPGSPYYMSPEQVRDELLDERTDIYSLGAILYEQACGSAPFAQASDPKEAAVHHEAQLASEAVFRTGPVARDGEVHPLDPADTAQARSTSPDELAERLRTGLDQIVLTALCKDRADRFPSVRRLSEAIQTCLWS